MNMKRLGRLAALVLTGGVLLQVGGCSTFLVPLALSLGESVLVSLLFSGTTGF